MAILFPSIEIINKLKVQPTNGERALLDFLQCTLDDSFEVYFNPYLNGDRPDVIIMRKDQGVMIIEVKDWNLDNYTINDRKQWKLNKNNSFVKSPLDQVFAYKKNLFNLHVQNLLQKKIEDSRYFRIVSCAVYFHCASQYKVDEKLVRPFLNDRKYQRFLHYNMDLIGKDGLNSNDFNSLLRNRYLISQKKSWLFTDEIYDNFKRILSPSVHLKTSGRPYLYTDKQKDIIYSTRLEQRIRGVFGSGKTTVLAARAVQAYKRALKRNPKPKILILTFNITLKNFIADKLNRVDEEFDPQSFVIVNYHQFIKHELNNLNILVKYPGHSNNPSQVSEFFEKKYFGNLKLFEEYQNQIVKYDAVLIDEIQDYNRSWMEIIKNCFRDSEGDYVLFGDIKQDIYGKSTGKRDVVTNVIGVNELKCCFRSDEKVVNLAKSFQKNIFKDKYDIDVFEENTFGKLQGLEIETDAYINYIFLQGEDVIPTLYNIIRGNIVNKNAEVSPNDITILGYTIDMLRTFDAYYRYKCREKTNSMFETIETMYMQHLNRIDYTEAYSCHRPWFNEISMFLVGNEKKYVHVAKLFTIFDLYNEFGEAFSDALFTECKVMGLDINQFLSFRSRYRKTLNEFNKIVYDSRKNYRDYEIIRNNKKFNFWMNSGTIKISTINSFKGWESEVVFLLIEPKYENNTSFNRNFDELLYTGLTRTKRNLVVINFGNKEYDQKLRPLINKVK